MVELVIMFQFLIGKVKTKTFKLLSNFLLRFQFLIGKVKTYFLFIFWLYVYLFQFLIGKVKTSSLGQQNNWGMDVSIPHR